MRDISPAASRDAGHVIVLAAYNFCTGVVILCALFLPWRGFAQIGSTATLAVGLSTIYATVASCLYLLAVRLRNPPVLINVLAAILSGPFWFFVAPGGPQAWDPITLIKDLLISVFVSCVLFSPIAIPAILCAPFCGWIYGRWIVPRLLKASH